MLLRILLLSVLTWSMSKCEPPVNSYLPPSSGSSKPSSQYGSPGGVGRGPTSSAGRDGVQNQQNQFQNGGKPDAPSNQYGPPSSNANQQSGSSVFGGSSQGKNSQNQPLDQPNSQYGTPNQFGGSHGGPNERLTSSGSGFGQGSGRNQRPENSYGPPPTGDFQSTNSASERYSNNQQQGHQGEADFNGSSNGFGSQSSSPFALYGAPGFGNNGGGARSGQLRNQNGHFDGDNSNEPAKYEFSYDVDDEQTGTKFGHSEQRDGDLATGEYNVVLPDGRKQVVEYEAGLQGYKPQIRYEGSVGGQGGIRGFQQGETNSLTSGSSSNGFGQQDGSPSRYQEASSFSSVDAGQGDGYPRGGPGANGANGFAGNGFGSSGPSSENSRKGLNSDQSATNGGYPSGRPRNGGSFAPQNSPQSGSGSGYPSGGPQNGGSFSNGGEGYPSGGPNGARGSGY